MFLGEDAVQIESFDRTLRMNSAALCPLFTDLLGAEEVLSWRLLRDFPLGAVRR